MYPLWDANNSYLPGSTAQMAKWPIALIIDAYDIDLIVTSGLSHSFALFKGTPFSASSTVPSMEHLSTDPRDALPAVSPPTPRGSLWPLITWVNPDRNRLTVISSALTTGLQFAIVRESIRTLPYSKPQRGNRHITNQPL